MQVFFTADPHLGHANITKWRYGESFPEWWNDNLVLTQWAALPKKSLIFVLGDVAWNDDSLLKLDSMPGRKILISGNHDNLTSQGAQRQVFEKVFGFLRYKQMWLSHAPVHPSVVEESRCFVNIHGHTHKDEPKDERYFSVDFKVLIDKGHKPFITLEELQSATAKQLQDAANKRSGDIYCASL